MCVCCYCCCSVTKSCLTVCDPMDCSPPGSSVHGILQARILEWVAMPSSRRSSQPRDLTQVSHIAGRFFTIWTTREAQEYCSGYVYICVCVCVCVCVCMCVCIYIYIYIYPHFKKNLLIKNTLFFFSTIGYFKIWNIVPCAMVLVVCLFYI